MTEELSIDGDDMTTPAVKIAAWIPLSTNDVTFMAEPLYGLLDVRSSVDRIFNPWKYPDRPAWPSFTPLPRVERARIGLSVARTRVRDAWSVLRGQESLSDEGDDW